MRAIDVEHWALMVIDQVKNQSGIVESTRVELKREWPRIDTEHSIRKAARLLAAHANAARGEDILWLVGVDEEACVVDAQREELSTWWPRICSAMVGPHPELLQNVDVNVDGQTIVALLFGTDQPPYVVKATDKECSDRLEVPWRE